MDFRRFPHTISSDVDAKCRRLLSSRVSWFARHGISALMNPFVRNGCCWLLAALSMLLSLGNSAGLVLCIEADGSMAIESPEACAACRNRHEVAADRAAARVGDHGIAARTGETTWCVDIPLTVAAAPAPTRPMSALGMRADRFDSATICWVSSTIAPPRSLQVLPGSLAGSSPPPTLAALENVVLLV